MAIMSTVESAIPSVTNSEGIPVNFGIPWQTLTSALNLLLTILISVRLLRARNEARGFLSPEIVATYTHITSIIVESVLPFSLWGIPATIMLGVNSPIQAPFIFIWGALAVSVFVAL